MSLLQQFFFKSKEKIKKHISLCARQAGFNFVFDNGKIVHYQDNYKKIGGLSFSLYFDFETTTDSVVFMQKCMWLAIVLLLLFIQI